ncbi:MAG: ABC transporter substrate-binding protein [Chloroflexota bacterium]
MGIRKRKLLVIAGVLTVIGLLLASCGPAAQEPTTGGPTTGGPTTGGPTTGGPTTGGPTTTTPPVPKEGAGILRYAMADMAFRNAMDPVGTMNINGGFQVMQIWDSLLNGDATGNYLPALATSWTIADNWSYYEFTIRQGVKFSNGDPVTAKDIKFSLDLYRAKNSLNSYAPELREYVKDTTVVDDYHVRVYLNMPYPGLIDRCPLRLGIMPMDYYNKVGFEGFCAKPIGAGPFKVVDFKQDQWLNLEAVPNHYFNTPYIKGVHIVYVKEPATRMAMLKTGEVDMKTVTPEFVLDLNADPNLRKVVSTYFSGTSLVWLDLADVYKNEPSPWKDIRMRQACSYAIDRKTMCDKIFNGAYTPMGHFLAPYNLGYDPSLDTQYPPPPYDPVKAKQLMAEAGYPNGVDVNYPCSPENRYFAEAICAYLNDVGIRAKIQMFDAGTLSRETYAVASSAGKLHGILTRGSPSWYGIRHVGVACTAMMGGGSASSYGVVNPAVKAAIEASFPLTSEQDLKVAGKKINDLELSGHWSAPLWVNNTIFGIGPRVAEFTPVKGRSNAWRLDLIKLTD